MMRRICKEMGAGGRGKGRSMDRSATLWAAHK